MENSSSWLLAITLAFLALLKKLIFTKPQYSKQNSTTPPGPKPWPIIGNLNLLGELPHQSLHALSQKYGDIMQLWYGNSPVVVVSSPDMAKQFLRTHDSVFASRPLLSAGKYVSCNYSDMSRAPYGPHWRHTRKIFMELIFTAEKSQFYEHIRHEERHKLLSRMHAHSGEPVVLRQHLKSYTMSTISRIVYGDWHQQEHENTKDDASISVDELLAIVQQWFVLYGKIDIGDWIPWLSFFDIQGYNKKAKAFVKDYSKFHNAILHRRGAKPIRKDMVAENVLDALLQRAQDPDNPDVKLTSGAIQALSLDLLAAGSDTSALATEWAFLEIMRHPRIMDKAKEELNRVIGKNRWVEEKDCPQLPYIEAIIMETMRLHPIATLLPSHYSMEDCNVAGYHVAKGSMVSINVWAIGRDPSVWDAPEEFLPERFLEGEKIDMSGGDFRLLPFGSGRRKCPAEKLGTQTVRLMLANLLHGFDFRLVDGKEPGDISVEENYGLTTEPKVPLVIIPEPALDIHY